MRVTRDEAIAEVTNDSNMTTINIVIEGDHECTEQKLDNILQFALLGLGIDVRYKDPPTETPVEVPSQVDPEPASVHSMPLQE